MRERLSRRSFLRYGAGAVAGSVVGRPVGAQHAAPAPVAPPEPVSPADFELEEATIADLQDAMRTGPRTSRSICAAYLARIAELDPKLHAVLETTPDAPISPTKWTLSARQDGYAVRCTASPFW